MNSSYKKSSRHSVFSRSTRKKSLVFFWSQTGFFEGISLQNEQMWAVIKTNLPEQLFLDNFKFRINDYIRSIFSDAENGKTLNSCSTSTYVLQWTKSKTSERINEPFVSMWSKLKAFEQPAYFTTLYGINTTWILYTKRLNRSETALNIFSVHACCF